MDVIWIDANTLNRIAEGDKALEGELLAMRAKGIKILVVPKVWESSTVGNPFRKDRPSPNMKPETVMAVKAAFERIGAEHDLAGTQSDRRELAERAIQPYDDPNNKQMYGKLPVERHEEDYVVLSQIAASAKARVITQPRILSLDGGVRNTHAPRFGVTGVNRTTTPSPKLVAGIGSAEESPSSSSSNGKSAVTSLDINQAHTIIKNGLTRISEEKAIDEAIVEFDKKKQAIEEMMEGNPGMDIRVDCYFTFQPGVNPDFNDHWFFEALNYGPHPGSASGIVTQTKARGELRHDTVIMKNPWRVGKTNQVFSFQSVSKDLAYLWNVTIGDWKGIFEFDLIGNVYWAGDLNGTRHQGHWYFTENQIQFEFYDDPPQRKRQWVVKTSELSNKVVNGFVKPEGLGGFFVMTKIK